MELVCRIGVRVVFIFMLVRCYPEAPYIVNKPSIDLSAQDVVMAQVKALRNNDSPHKNAGIQTAYNFASPYLKAENGPLQRYELMYNSRVYRTLLNGTDYFIREHFVNDKRAEYFVFVTDQEGIERGYLFKLSKQTMAPHEGCWMTDEILAYASEQDMTGEYYIALR